MPRPGSQGLVSLLTDFGSRDTWVGQMKAVMLAVSPSLRLVDLTHHVPPQDVELGALLLAE
ncbi:MAG: SAM-dependent chlorinase/fluorinase, partial [Deltaproteobacteria bacterium]|nr:SAM-dependent chlorinase/fluorinase [Deltaproteobacteria bacterium]